MYGDGEPLFALIVAVLYGGYLGFQRLQNHFTPDEGSVERVHERYVDGELTETELERRVELALDPRAEEIRDVVERVDGIGPETSATIAMHFESVGDLRDADRDELEAVHGVGPSTSRAIQKRV